MSVIRGSIHCILGDVIQIQGGFYGDGLGMVWLKGLQCLGNETNLLQCPVDHGYYHCSHSYDVSVICPGMFSNFACFLSYTYSGVSPNMGHFGAYSCIYGCSTYA